MNKFSKVNNRISMGKALALALLMLIIISQTGCGGNTASSTDPVSDQGFYLDTICGVTIYAMEDMSEENANKVIEGAFELCQEYESILSKTVETSDIYKINHAGGEAVTCDDRTIEVIQKGIYYCQLSDGKFDITLGKVTDLWDFESGDNIVPEDEDIKEALSHVGYENIIINGNEVSLADEEAEIDLGGIAKGYIADKLAEYLKENGVTGGIIDLGGNLSIVGYKDGTETDFNIGIKKPFSETGELIGTIPAHDKSFVTSGTYERYFEIDGTLYHHILDVNTGYPVNTGLSGVTIIGNGDQGIDCDALATVCLVLGKEDGISLIESIDGIEAIFVSDDETVETTSGVEGFTQS